MRRNATEPRGVPPSVAVINTSTILSDKEARRGLSGIIAQVKKHFAPVWNVKPEIHFVGRGKRAERGTWQLVLLDERNADDGYHQLTRDGLPLGKVFLRQAMKTPSGWTTTASHELLELLVDPGTILGSFVEHRSLGPRVYAYEICDPVQDDRFAYEIEGVAVSDFVYPSWFEPWRARRSVRFDYAGKLSVPFEVPRDCYAMFYDVRKRLWRDNWGGRVTPHLTVPEGTSDRGGSRRALRGSPRLKWKKSDV
jgi:hypothetical protein